MEHGGSISRSSLFAPLIETISAAADPLDIDINDFSASVLDIRVQLRYHMSDARQEFC